MFKKPALVVKLIGFALFAVIFFSYNNVTHAQETSFGIANDLIINGKDIKDGNIISSSENSYILSNRSYDPFMVGVVTLNPAVHIEVDRGFKTYPVIAIGSANVLVNLSNGAIKRGDPITSSATPGIGMKATRTGYVIGQALEDFNSNNPKDIRKIPVSLNIYYFYSRPSAKPGLSDLLNLSVIATYEQPSVVFRYFVAGLIIIIAFILGFISFGRTANTGIEALGRNPLASRMIQIGILLNVAITVVIVIAGFAVAFLVLRL